MITSSDVLAVVRDLSLSRSATDVMRTLTTSVRQLVGADGITVVLRENDMCHYAEEDAIAPLWKGRRFPMSACISGWCMLHREQVSIVDIYADDRIPHDAYRPTFVKSLAMTPIRRESPIGAIGAYWADRHDATGEELACLQSIGDSASITLANVQLMESLSDANVRKDQFLAMLAHELRNPLGPIRSASHVLQLLAGTNGAAREAAEVIDRQMTHLGRILDGLLDAARLQHGRVALARDRVDLRLVLAQLLDDLRPEFRRANISLTATLGAAPVWMSADATRLRQIFENLLENAQKFSPAGAGVTVTLNTDRAGYASVRVRDTGCGIEPRRLGSIFEAFAQADETLDRAPGGLGLGLAVAKGLVGLHGGTIHAESNGLGSGAEFVVRLPAEQQLPPTTPLPSTTRERSARGRVLVIEDNEDAATMLKAVLQVSGFNVLVEHNGLDGIRTARSERPTAILCDIGLPGADGYQVASTLRGDPAVAGTRMIAVTGYGTDDDRQRALRAGFDAHLVKPVPPKMLLQELAATA